MLCIELEQCCKFSILFLWHIECVLVNQGQLQEAKWSLSEAIFMNGLSLCCNWNYCWVILSSNFMSRQMWVDRGIRGSSRDSSKSGQGYISLPEMIIQMLIDQRLSWKSCSKSMFSFLSGTAICREWVKRSRWTSLRYLFQG